MSTKSDKKRVFKVLLIENEGEESKIVEKEFAVILPTLKIQLEANKVRSKTFHRLLKEGVMLRDELDKALKERDMWNTEKETEFNRLKAEVLEGEYALSQGGIKLSEARSIAIKMKKNREEMINLLTSRSELDSQTCEGQADQDRFNYLFVNCLVYNDEVNTPYFKGGLAEYLENSDDPVAVKAASEFYYLISNSGPVDNTLPENQFLKEYEFVDNNLRLIDPNTKRLVNENNQYVDSLGNLIKYNEDGTYYYVDINGKKIDMETGTYAVDSKKPFLDDDGNPVIHDSSTNQDDVKPKTKRQSKKTVESK